MDNNLYEWSEKAEKATEKGKNLKFLRYGKNLKYNIEGIYSYGIKITNLDLKQKTIQTLGYWSPTSSKHFNYAAHLLDICYGFRPIYSDMIHVQHLSYDDHT